MKWRDMSGTQTAEFMLTGDDPQFLVVLNSSIRDGLKGLREAEATYSRRFAMEMRFTVEGKLKMHVFPEGEEQVS